MIEKPSAKKSSLKKLQHLKKAPCVSCGKTPSDIDHIRSRGSGGSNDPENCWSLCRICHTKKHSEGLNLFVERRPHLTDSLVGKGWSFDNYLKKWRRP